MTFLLIIHDGSKMRAFHPSVMDEDERRIVDQVAKRLMYRADGLFDTRTEMPFSASDHTYTTPFTEMTRIAGYTGDVCPSCHGFRVKRTGTCVTCEDCGNNAGCG